MSEWTYGYICGMCAGCGIALGILGHWVGVLVFTALFVGVFTHHSIYGRDDA